MTAFGCHPLRLQPGRRDSIVRPPRPDLAALVGLGQPAALLPARMASLHALCAHGHRLAATLALRAARGEAAVCSATEREGLRQTVAREHLLRIAHDWPRLLPGAPTAAPSLQGCPMWHTTLAPAQQLAALPAWLERCWLQRKPAELDAALVDDPGTEALAWARNTPTALAALFGAVLPHALRLRTPNAGVDVRDTGAWTRRHDPRPLAADNAGMRLIARLHELLRLAGSAGDAWLAAGGTPLGAGEGSASVELGRGTLRTRVRLDAGEVVRGLQIESPTDRNVHPEGVLARALHHVDGADDAALLATAFDPCEPFEIVLQPETADA